jgi:hypothetical protein
MEKVKQFPFRELSLSYIPKMVKTAGSYNGEAYDEIQTEIVINNLAIVSHARAGENARLHLDGKDEEKMDEETKNKEAEKDLTQDDVTDAYEKLKELEAKYEAGGAYEPSDIAVVIEAFKDLAKRKKEYTEDAEEPKTPEAGEEGLFKKLVVDIVDVLDKRAGDYYKKEAPALDKKMPDEEKEPDVKLDSTDIDAILRDRMALISVGAKMGMDVAHMTPTQAKLAVIQKALPDIRLDGLRTHEAALNAVYHTAVSAIEKRKPIENQYEGFIRTDGKPPTKSSYAEAHQKYTHNFYNNNPGGDK